MFDQEIRSVLGVISTIKTELRINEYISSIEQLKSKYLSQLSELNSLSKKTLENSLGIIDKYLDVRLEIYDRDFSNPIQSSGLSIEQGVRSASASVFENLFSGKQVSLYDLTNEDKSVDFNSYANPEYRTYYYGKELLIFNNDLGKNNSAIVSSAQEELSSIERSTVIKVDLIFKSLLFKLTEARDYVNDCSSLQSYCNTAKKIISERSLITQQDIDNFIILPYNQLKNIVEAAYANN